MIGQGFSTGRSWGKANLLRKFAGGAPSVKGVLEEEDERSSAWRVGSSVAEVVALETSVHATREREQQHHSWTVDFFEWRQHGYAHHQAVSVKELLEWFSSSVASDRRASASLMAEMPAIAARDLRKLLGGRKSKASQPFLTVRSGGILCSVAELDVSAIILHGRVFLFLPRVHGVCEQTREMLGRLDSARRASARLGGGGAGSGAGNGAQERGASRLSFGFYALDALLSEICAQLRAQSETLVTEAEYNLNSVMKQVSEQMVAHAQRVHAAPASTMPSEHWAAHAYQPHSRCFRWAARCSIRVSAERRRYGRRRVHAAAARGAASG